jgi:hypothetical protein
VQIDFHYNTIRVLTEKAGFSPEDSQIIAYASQYVDDAVDHKKMNVQGHLEILSKRFTGSTFDPICTAHRGLQFIKAFKEGVQNKIYIPFHFLPDLEDNGDFCVKQNSKQSKELVQSAIVELSKSQGEKRIMNLIRLGIALHTYADSWAHQNFSGRHNPKENNIGKIELFNNGKWERITRLKQFEYNTLPDIGHAEAASYPDQSHLKWRFVKEVENQVYERDNTALFLDAAKNIINLFKGTNSLEFWSSIRTKLQECFSYQPDLIEDKFKKFQAVFPEIGFYYDANQWREEALSAVNNKKLMKVIDDNDHYVLGSDKKWFYFHLAALEQREYVLKLLNNSNRTE